jgi:DNA-binding NtrC family response regulator
MARTKVLLVDDEVEFVSALAERLQMRNYDAQAVYSAEDAITVARSNPPDVMLLDLKMPVMSGMEVLKYLKQYIPDIKVIMLTGHGTVDEGPEGKSGDIFDYAMKPIDINELIEKIEKAKQKHAGN